MSARGGHQGLMGVAVVAGNVVLQMDPSTPDGATVFNDLVGRAYTCGALAMAVPGLDGSCIELSGTASTSSCVVAHHADLLIMGGDFTIEAFVRMPSALPGTPYGLNVLGTGSASSDGWQFRMVNGGLEWVYPGLVGTGLTYTWAANTTYHVAVCRQGSQHYLAVNGVVTPKTMANRTSQPSDGLRIGGYSYGGAGQAGSKYISAKVTKGMALYTSNFKTPPLPLSLWTEA